MQSNTHPSYHNHIKAFLPYIFFHCSYVVYAILHMNHLWNTPNNHLRIQKDICILFISNVIKEMEIFFYHSSSFLHQANVILSTSNPTTITQDVLLHNTSILLWYYNPIYRRNSEYHS